MDKYEYRVRAEQIKTLLEKHEYVDAMNVADTVDWRRVKSVSMLCTVSEIYKINRKYEESRDILLLAYERYPGGRMIVYALCELSIKMEEYVQAVEYMKEFVQVAPRDTGIFILRYKLYEAQDVPLEERIEVLEEFKKRDYRERWAYELAYLYHRVGLGTRCVEECDELILWFGEGKYVTKAMELKMLHEPLTPEQQAKYEGRNIAQAAPTEYEPKRPMDVVSEESLRAMRAAGDRLAVEQTSNLSQLFGELPPESAEVSQVINDNEFEVKPVNMSKFSTMNLQAELAKSMQEFLVPENEYESQDSYAEQPMPQSAPQPVSQPIPQPVPQPMPQPMPQPIPQPMPQPVPQPIPQSVSQPLPQPVQMTEEQVSLNIPDDGMVERQITGQIHIDEVLKEWETKKQDSANKRKEDAKRRVLDQTNDLLSQLVGIVPGVVAPVIPEEPAEELKEDSVKIQEQSADEKPVEEVHQKVTEVTGSVIKSAFDDQDKKRALEVTGSIPDIILPSRKETAVSPEAESDLDVEIPTASLTQPVQEQPETQPIQEVQPEQEIQQVQEVRPEQVIQQVQEVQPEQVIQQVQEVRPEQVIQQVQEVQPEQVIHEAPVVEDIEEGIEEIEEIEQPEEIPEELPVDEVTQETHNIEETEEIEETAKTDEQEDEEAEGDSEEDDLEEIEEAPKKKKNKKNLPSYMTIDRNPKSKRDFDEEERKIFASFDGIEVVKAQIVEVMEQINMDGSTGNVVLMGALESGRKGLAIDIVRAMQIIDSRFSGKVAKITGKALNKKDIPITLGKLTGGALIIEEAGEISKENMQILTETLQNVIENIIVVIEDTKGKLQPFLDTTKSMKKVFNAVIDIPEYSNDDLVSYAKSYAKSLEYVIDEMGVLALYTRLGELQTLDHIVSLEEVREIVDGAIKHVDRKNMSHFMDILFAKRYDDDDYIILREKDFITK